MLELEGMGMLRTCSLVKSHLRLKGVRDCAGVGIRALLRHGHRGAAPDLPPLPSVSLFAARSGGHRMEGRACAACESPGRLLKNASRYVTASLPQKQPHAMPLVTAETRTIDNQRKGPRRTKTCMRLQKRTMLS